MLFYSICVYILWIYPESIYKGFVPIFLCFFIYLSIYMYVSRISLVGINLILQKNT
jgi:hypothetical protein